MTIQVRSNEKPQTPPPPAPPAVAPELGESSSGSADGESKEASSQLSEHDPESTEAEQKESLDSETGEAEGKEEGVEEHPKKKGGFQRRIDKLNSQKAQAQQEMEYWKQQALRNASAQGNPPPQQQPQQQPPNQVGKPKPDDFDSHAEYVEALTDWKTELKFKEREEKAQRNYVEQDQAKVMQAYHGKVQTFIASTPDFKEVLMDVDHVPMSAALRDIVLHADNGPELIYSLAKDPAEFERINRLNPLACAREVGKFEARAFTPKPSASTEGKKITGAPKPIETVGTGKGSVHKSIHDPSLSQREYEALRKEQIKKRRQAG